MDDFKNAYINCRYEGFDFHHECRKMRYERLSILIDRLAHEQDEFSYFLINNDGIVISEQEGIFRTNCIDCLDRTNVVQSLLALRSLTITLQVCLSNNFCFKLKNVIFKKFNAGFKFTQKLNILRPEQTIRDQPVLESLFKNVWADNADAISLQYSGTPALKTDFTRTGKRTRLGIIRDGINSLTR